MNDRQALSAGRRKAMRNFNNILYASTGMGDDTEGLKQALSLTRSNQAAMKIVLVYPEFPKTWNFTDRPLRHPLDAG